MPVFAVCALVGILGGLWLPVFSAASHWPLAMLLGGSLAWWVSGARLLVAVVAFAFASLQGHWYQEYSLPEPLVSKDIVVEGVIAELPRVSKYSTSFLFRLLPQPSHAAFPQFAILRIYAPGPTPKAGERWQFKVRLKRPVSTVNSGGLDYESWLMTAHIHARGYVRDSPVNRRVAIAARYTSVLRFRSRVRDAMGRVLAANPALPLITGISIGARDGISRPTWQVLRDSGTSHLVAISGLHIGLLALASWWPGRFLGWLLFCLGWVKQPLAVARSCVLIAACCYGLLAGSSIPTVRATVMLAVALLLAAMQRQRRPRSVLGAALVIVLTLHPLSVLSGGFWLSFAAVALLYTFLGQPWASRILQDGWRERIKSGCRSAIQGAFQSQLLLSLGLALPTLLIFGKVSLVAPLANLVAVPLFTIWILPATLAGAALTAMNVSPGAPLLSVAAVGLVWLTTLLKQLVELPAATWQPGNLAWTSIAVLSAGIMVLLLPRPFPGRLAALALIVCVVCSDNRPFRPPLRVRVLDVGQGLSVLVQTPAHNLLYDAGGAWPGGDAGEFIIVPALAAEGVRSLDALIVSHDDSDHRGGVDSLLRAIDVNKILASGKQDYPPAGNPQKCRHGMSWQWDGVSFRILHPAAGKHWSENDASCVLLVEFAGSALLLPGDIESGAEFALLRQTGLRTVDLVLGPHHGSRTSSGPAFVRELEASFVVFSAGYANRWDFPAADVVARWLGGKACILTTAVSGALEFVPVNGGGFRLVAAARTSLTRPWPVRNARAGACINTINGVDGTV